jgi:hypothetical protein
MPTGFEVEGIGPIGSAAPAVTIIFDVLELGFAGLKVRLQPEAGHSSCDFVENPLFVLACEPRYCRQSECSYADGAYAQFNGLIASRMRVCV